MKLVKLLFKFFASKKAKEGKEPDRGDILLDKGVDIGYVNYPAEGGQEAHLQGFRYPMEGLLDERKVAAVANFKTMIPVATRWVVEGLKEDYMPKDERQWCRVVREIRRCFNILIEHEQAPKMKKKWADIRDMISMFMEYDDAYRYRVQHAFSQMDMEKIKLTDGDKYWFARMWYSFEDKERFRKMVEADFAKVQRRGKIRF